MARLELEDPESQDFKGEVKVKGSFSGNTPSVSPAVVSTDEQKGCSDKREKQDKGSGFEFHPG